jgi:outer membrane protein OmpA-like peptidoglycan-associated protein
MKPLWTARALTALALALTVMPHQAGGQEPRQLSVDEMEQALKVAPAPATPEGARFRSPTFSAGDAALESGGTPESPEGPAGFSVPIQFDFGSSKVINSFLSTIDNVAEVLRRNPVLRLTIRGHTDAVGSASVNLTLSRQRAEVVRRAIVERGIPPSRLTAEGVGETMLIPRINAEDEKNRRVEFLRTD